MSKLDEAREGFKRYLAFTNLAPGHRAYGLYYRGNLHYRAKEQPDQDAGNPVRVIRGQPPGVGGRCLW